AARCLLLTWLTAMGLVAVCSLAAQAIPIPPHNRAELREAPPRPPSDQRLQDLGRALFAAIAQDAPAQAEPCFFPREAFLRVKAIADPGRYWDQLHTRFAKDIHGLHRQLSD